MANSTTNITVTSVTILSNSTVSLDYSNGTQPIIETSAGNIIYTLGENCAGWQFIGVVPFPPSDISYSVSGGGSILTFVDTDTISETYNFRFQLSYNSAVYTSQDPQIIDEPK